MLMIINKKMIRIILKGKQNFLIITQKINNSCKKTLHFM